MRPILTTVIVLIFACELDAQRPPINIEVNDVVDTSNAEISQVIRLWKNYLSSKPDSNYVNPFWSEAEQRQYKPFDLAAHTWWSASLYLWLGRCHIQVLSVSKIENSYIIRTIFYNLPSNSSGEVSVISIINTGARLEDGSYKLCNALTINTTHWHKEQVGSIKFVFPPDHTFNPILAREMSNFVDSLAKDWQLTVVPIDYYFAEDIERVTKALGFDYWPAEGNETGPRGVVDPHNRIAYSGGSNEWYPHEMVHLYIFPRYPNAHHYFHEGYATLVGGCAGHDLVWHLKRNYEYLKAHPETDALTFRGVDLYVTAPYFIGGLLCKMAMEKGGIAAVRKLMSYGSEDKDLYLAIKEVFGIDKVDVDSFLRLKLAEYAVK